MIQPARPLPIPPPGGSSILHRLDEELPQMLKRSLPAAVVALIGLGVLGLGLAVAGPATTEDPTTIKDIMKKLNGKGADTESAKLKKALAAKKTDWDTVQASTKVYSDLGAKLPDDTPRKGD